MLNLNSTFAFETALDTNWCAELRFFVNPAADTRYMDIHLSNPPMMDGPRILPAKGPLRATFCRLGRYVVPGPPWPLEARHRGLPRVYRSERLEPQRALEDLQFPGPV